VKVPVDFYDICKDLKVLGRREMKILVRWRTKVLKSLEKQKQKVKEEEESLSSDEELTKKILKQ